jgi:predicted  nucleic acid-binding Zn-ribbon protein
MAGGVEAFYRLQSIDTEIDKMREALRSIEKQLADNTELLAAEEAARVIRESLRELRNRLRGLELDLGELASKIASTESALYGGEVSSPKELAGMEQELEYLRRRRSIVEDDTLHIMAEVEEQEENLRAADERLARGEEQSEEVRGALLEEGEQLRTRLTVLEAQREEIARTISARELAIYEGLRQQKGGQAVVLLENGICQGCRVALPTSVVQRVRRGSEVVYCGSCQRILYLLH